MELTVEFMFDELDIGVDVATGIALVITAVFEFALRIFAFAFTFTFVSPHDESTKVPAATVNKYPAIFFISSPQDLSKNRGQLRAP